MPEEGISVTDEEVERQYLKLDKQTEEGGYHLNPDVEFAKELVYGLIYNEKRYGYWACPCRIAEGDIDEDRDMICPCIYRDPDLSEYGSCYCALYVDDKIKKGEKQAKPIPERRPSREEREEKKKEKAMKDVEASNASSIKVQLPVWRCTVCGYLCAREEPPLVCPVCKAKKDRFERFL